MSCGGSKDENANSGEISDSASDTNSATDAIPPEVIAEQVAKKPFHTFAEDDDTEFRRKVLTSVTGEPITLMLDNGECIYGSVDAYDSERGDRTIRVLNRASFEYDRVSIDSITGYVNNGAISPGLTPKASLAKARAARDALYMDLFRQAEANTELPDDLDYDEVISDAFWQAEQAEHRGLPMSGDYIPVEETEAIRDALSSLGYEGEDLDVYADRIMQTGSDLAYRENQLAVHAVKRAGMGDVIATMCEVDASPATYGDYAVGTAYENVTRAQLPDGTYRTTSRGYYVEDVGKDSPTGVPSYRLMESTHTQVHSDSDDPGSSEVTSDYRYRAISERTYGSLEEAQQAIRGVAQRAAEAETASRSDL